MNKTKKLMAGVATSVMAFSMSGCGQNQYDSATLPPEPTEYECDDWEWDDDEGTYYCDDRKSSHFGAYYLLGSMFSNRSALRSSPNYSSNLNQYKNTQNNYKSGIGSGSKGGFGG